ncbi:hypothetical protein B0A48_02228 [Cryoendolithus antarcticus]|uniref:BRCT domain-containing protein n=1 Tax=Cryoendolithus antarcticus TaxID=1507870 RepID=A0A1V8TN81_9PEZI|nr:hypothetical protein B0A48_02228 [Cryoendolithus antarcticus]
MVATRRGARTTPVEEPVVEEKTLALRKKPVRRATATKAAPAESKTATLRGTRSRRAIEIAAGEEEKDEPGPAKETEAPVAKRAGRTKKTAPVEPPATMAIGVEEESKAAKLVAHEVKRPVISQLARMLVPPGPELETTSRATRQRKPLADAMKPLSPKKITQVNGTRSRGKTASTDATTKAQVKPKPQITARTTRRRNVSDENEDVLNLHPSIDLDSDAEIAEPVKPMLRPASPAKPSPQNRAEPVEESEASMSSRPTTPSDSAAPVFRQPVDYTEDAVDGAVSDVDEDEHVTHHSASEDELCGPKTPMKRAVGGNNVQFYNSAQKSRNAPTPLPSVACTVTARFISPVAEAQSSPAAMPRHQSRDTAEKAVAEHEMSESYDDTQVVGSDIGTMHHEPLCTHDDPNETIVISDGEADSSLTTLSSTPQPPVPTHDLYVAPSVPSSVSQTLSTPMATYESDDSIMISPVRAHSQPEYDEEDFEDASLEDDSEVMVETSASLEPETIPWGNLRQDITIPVNFDLHFADVRSPAAQQSQNPHEESLDMSDMRPTRLVATNTYRTASPVRDQTVNLNDFIDFGALAEPTQRIELPLPAAVDYESGEESEEEEEVDWFAQEAPVAHPQDAEETEAEYDLDEVTVVITRRVTSTPAPAADESFINLSIKDVPQEVEQPVNSYAVYDAAPDDTEEPEESAGNMADAAEASEMSVPHYALPTVAFDARRKSLPAFGQHTPVKPGSRPNTSDGASIARVARPFEQPWWTHSRRQSTSSGVAATPMRLTAHKSTSTSTSDLRGDFSGTPSRIAQRSAQQTPRERFPRLAPQDDYERHAQTVAGPTRYQTPVQKVTPRAATALRPKAIVDQAGSTTRITTPSATPRSRYPRLAAKEVPKPALATPAQSASGTTTLTAQDPRSISTIAAATPVPDVRAPAATPRQRFPRLAAKNSYSEHAATVSAVSRFRTPTQASPKRPSTTLRPQSTPIKTPLKPAGQATPARAAMTPHPSAPLRGAMILVEIFTLDGASASAPFIALLHRLGARTTKNWSERVTHVVFKDGSPTTMQRVRLHNKDVESTAKGTKVHCVNSRWVSDCESEGGRCDETDEAYAVDVTEVPRGGSRRRKSMEPSALINIGGNVVKDRKSSLGGRSSVGRTSFGRSPLKALTFESPVKSAVEKENVDESSLAEEPATPAYLAAPDKLVQMTAPMKRVKKLELNAGQGRRLTSLWDARD